MRGISFAFIGLTSLLAQGAVVFTKQGAVDAPRSVAAESNELFPLPAGFKIEPDLDVSKKPSTPGAKVIKIRQGPFKLTPKVELLQDEQFLTEPPLLPCTDCWITAIQGGLEFANGTAATVEQGAILQHLYILSGSGRDEVCRTYNLPQPNRLYVTGNERETVRLNPDGLKYGQYLAAADEWFALRWNAVNTGTAPLDVFLTQVRLLLGSDRSSTNTLQTYEYIPNAQAKDFKNVTTAYMDLGGCGGTWFSPQSGQFEFKSFTWKSSITGKILFVAGHVHEVSPSIELSWWRSLT
jgi:hypothetical protein